MNPKQRSALQKEFKGKASAQTKKKDVTVRRVKVTFGFADDKGARSTMEDAHAQIPGEGFAFFGVFDGHGGSAVAHFAAAKLYENCKLTGLNDDDAIEAALRNGFLKTHEQLTNEALEEFLKNQNFDSAPIDVNDQGSTAVVAYTRHNSLYVANAGDARAVLSRNGVAEDLSEDHKPTTNKEKERLEKVQELQEKAGGEVCGRIGDRIRSVKSPYAIAVSRALGDKNFNPCITPEPEITQTTLNALDSFLILACDGVWDVLTSQEAVDVVKAALGNKNTISNDDCKKAAQALVKEALVRNTTDNLTVIVVGFDM
jgi:serine/threonine protein phosphatase PrpC